MHFNSVEQIITRLEQQPGWEKFRAYRQLLKCWEQTVSQKIARHTRPLYINRQILYVATSSAARAQELTFQRYTLCKRLNQQLPFELKDLRFSDSQWHQTADGADDNPSEQPIIFTISDRLAEKSLHRQSALGRTGTSDPTENSAQTTKDRAKEAARRWLINLEQRSATASYCPICNSAAPTEELKRWNCCHHCIANKWSQEYSPAVFPETK